jgi:FdrA protein
VRVSAQAVEVRRGVYHDSVALMQASRVVATADGVEAALVAMATELNLDALDAMGFPRPDGATPGDLVVAVRAADDEALARGLQTLDAALAGSSAGEETAAGVAPARTTGAAAVRRDATLALVSVPGPFAFVEAMDALAAGLHVMVFSDNVPVAQEVRLKQEGARRGLLVMGPDCGTAVVNGVGLGFANVVRPGAVGIVAASGTGAQQLMCLLDGAGVGISSCLGVGGRDLSADIGGLATRQALAMLDGDPATGHIVLVSKPPAKEVAEAVLAYASELATPVQVAFLGGERSDLTATAADAVAAVGGTWTEPHSWEAPGPAAGTAGLLRGLFSGGTLCDEAMVLAARTLGPIASNIPLLPGWALPEDLRASGHAMIDFGDDRLTRGRPHPMIDTRSRLERLAAEAVDPDVRVLLLDVVLGHGAHPDPAADLAPGIAAARAAARQAGRDLAVVVSLCGTQADPQDLHRQAGALRDSGASVHRSNSKAARTAVRLAAGAGAAP